MRIRLPFRRTSKRQRRQINDMIAETQMMGLAEDDPILGLVQQYALGLRILADALDTKQQEKAAYMGDKLDKLEGIIRRLIAEREAGSNGSTATGDTVAL